MGQGGGRAPPGAAWQGWRDAARAAKGLHFPLGGQRAGDWLRRCLQAEAERGRFALWAPVLVAGGVLSYFCWLGEPSLWIPAAVTAALGLGACALRARAVAGASMLALALLAAGFSLAAYRTDRVAAPRLHTDIGPTRIEGRIVWSEWRETGVRFALDEATIGRLKPETAPRRILVTWRGAETLPAPGARVSGLALLRPPPGPTAPGAYHWRRALFFQGIGATGFLLGSPVIGPPEEAGPRAALARFRGAITQRIFAALEGETGAVAAALLTGERGRIPEETNDALRLAGLYHILSISGMHMVLFAGTLFVGVRLALAGVPALALRYPIRKWAAFIALLGAAFYLVLSGASVATQRAFIMIAIVFLAVLVDRRALTMRNVAIAAFLLLTLFPESLLSAGFQMSFAATIALIAAYEAHGERRRARGGEGRDRSPFGTLWRYLGGLALTSLVAGLATAPFALYHFHLATPYALAGNLLAMPLVGFVVMPMGLLALIVMPVGLEALPLSVMGLGIEGVLAAARWVAGWRGASVPVPSIPAAALVFGVLSGLWLCLWHSPIRRLGAAGLVAAVLAAAADPPRPDLLVNDAGTSLAIRGGDGTLALSRAGRSSFAAERWLEADADGRSVEEMAASPAFSCDQLGCVGTLPGGILVAHVFAAAAFKEDCMLADIVVTPLTAPRFCTVPRLVIDAPRLALDGAHSVTWPERETDPDVTTALAPRRPWDAPAPWR